ncbi:hypothetical protein HK104_003000 [Borealophlyctis nickersoniae]|nr:hypothetical protein HK104_003000 [Borealophlyctis nickersoniae]
MHQWDIFGSTSEPGGTPPSPTKKTDTEDVDSTTTGKGGLVFTDTTGTKFLIIECIPRVCNHSVEPIWALARDRANRIFCLAKYLGFNPQYVRYTIATPTHSIVHPLFPAMEVLTSPGVAPPCSPYHPPLAEITPREYTPVLEPAFLDALEAMIGKREVFRGVVEGRREEVEVIKRPGAVGV